MSYAFSSESFLSYSSPAQVQPSFSMKDDFFDALSANEIDRAASVFASEGVLLFPGVRPMEGRALVKRMLGIIRRRYDEISWRPIGPVVSSNGWIVTSWSVHGTFKGAHQSYDNEVLSLARLDDDGRIAMLSDYFKDTGAFSPTPRGSGHDGSLALVAS